MNRVRVIEGDDYAGLYKEVLIDTPIGPYFMKYEKNYYGIYIYIYLNKKKKKKKFTSKI